MVTGFLKSFFSILSDQRHAMDVPNTSACFLPPTKVEPLFIVASNVGLGSL